MPYKNGKVDMKGYGANTSTVSPVVKEDTDKKKKLVKYVAKGRKGMKR
jgi:hypothetical protein